MRRLLIVAALCVAVLGAFTAPSLARRPNPEPGGQAPRDSKKSPPTVSCDVRGSRGDDVLSARANKVVCGFGGNDRITAGPGNVVYGGSGSDKLISPGASVLYGQGGRDRFCTHSGVWDLLYGGPGRDRGNVDAKFDGTTSIERELRPESCPSIRVRTQSANSLDKDLSGEVGSVDPTPVTHEIPISGEAAAQYFAKTDLSNVQPIPMPAVDEASTSALGKIPPVSGKPQATAPSAPRDLPHEATVDQLRIYDQGWFNRPIVGRLYIGDQGYCSGTLVAVNVVLTAAHCIYMDGGYWSGLGIPIGFRPNQWGDQDAGMWTARSETIHQGWIDSDPSDFNPDTFFPFDYGFFTLDPNANGVEAGNLLGWAGIVPGYVSDMWSLGYPSEGVFQQWDGDYPYYCYSPYGTYSTFNDADGKNWYDIAIGCIMTGGSSGGPWFTYYNDGWNYVASVNSHNVSEKGVVPAANMWGPYFTQATIDLYHVARGR